MVVGVEMGSVLGKAFAAPPPRADWEVQLLKAIGWRDAFRCEGGNRQVDTASRSRASSVHVSEADAQIIPAGDQRQERREPQADDADVMDPGPVIERAA